MNSPKISVIVPVYRVEPYLRKCLDSIVNQTYRELEIILVNDGSPDNCGAICDEYAAQDERIRVIHKPNGGVSSARNAGLAAAAGEWIGWVDPDDWIEPDFYEALLALAGRYGADILQSGMIYDAGGTQTVQFAPERTICCAKGVQAYPETGRHQYSNSVGNKLYRAEVLEGIRFRGNFLIGEDLLFNLDALARAGAVVLDSHAGYHYIQRSESVCHRVPDRRRLVSYREALLSAREEWRGYAEVQGFLLKEYLRNDLDICSKVVCFHLDWAEDLIREIQKELRQEIGRIVAEPGFSTKEKLKFALILFSFPVYRRILPHWKQIQKRQK